MAIVSSASWWCLFDTLYVLSIAKQTCSSARNVASPFFLLEFWLELWESQTVSRSSCCPVTATEAPSWAHQGTAKRRRCDWILILILLLLMETVSGTTCQSGPRLLPLASHVEEGWARSSGLHGSAHLLYCMVDISGSESNCCKSAAERTYWVASESTMWI